MLALCFLFKSLNEFAAFRLNYITKTRLNLLKIKINSITVLTIGQYMKIFPCFYKYGIREY